MEDTSVLALMAGALDQESYADVIRTLQSAAATISTLADAAEAVIAEQV